MADPKLDALAPRVGRAAAVDPVARLREIAAAGAVFKAPPPEPVRAGHDPVRIQANVVQVGRLVQGNVPNAAAVNPGNGAGEVASQAQLSPAQIFPRRNTSYAQQSGPTRRTACGISEYAVVVLPTARSLYSNLTLAFEESSSAIEFSFGDPKTVHIPCGDIVGYSIWYGESHNRAVGNIEFRYAYTRNGCVLIEWQMYVKGGTGAIHSPPTKFEVPDTVVKAPVGLPPGVPVVSVFDRAPLTVVSNKGIEVALFQPSILFYFPNCSSIKTVQLVRTYFEILDYCVGGPGKVSAAWDSDSRTGFTVDGGTREDPYYKSKATDHNGNSNVHQDAPGYKFTNIDGKYHADNLLKHLKDLGLYLLPKRVHIHHDFWDVFCCDGVFSSYSWWSADEYVEFDCGYKDAPLDMPLDIGRSSAKLTFGGVSPSAQTTGKYHELEEALFQALGAINPQGLC